jgi:hypothetical protein
LTAGEVVAGEDVVTQATPQQIVAIITPELVVACAP